MAGPEFSYREDGHEVIRSAIIVDQVLDMSNKTFVDCVIDGCVLICPGSRLPPCRLIDTDIDHCLFDMRNCR